jgi:non-heme chloroperoxidase
MVKDLICVVEALGGKRPILVGASMGGGVSLVAIGESHLEAAALVLLTWHRRWRPKAHAVSRHL